MRTLFLHIGTPKTGTSAVQAFMVRNRALLEEKGLVYPSFDIDYKVANENRNGSYIDLYWRDPVGESCVKKTLEAFDRGNMVLLSDEGLYERIIEEPEIIHDVTERFTKENINVKIIIYLRRQDEFIRSKWAQRVKVRERWTFDEYLERYCDRAILDYKSLLEILRDTVGMDDLIVRTYGRPELYRGNGKNLVSDFLSIFDIPLTEQYEKPDAIVNTSLTDKYLETKRRMNFMPDFQDKKADLISYLRRLQEKDEAAVKRNRPLFATADRIKLLSDYAGANREVANTYLGLPEGSDLFPMPEDRGGEEEIPFSEEEILEVLGNVILMLDNRNSTLERKLKIKDRAKTAASKQTDMAKRSVIGKVVKKLHRKLGM